jgi:hypothetical protein
MRLPLPQFATGDRHPNHIAEVIETTTTEFLAQCLDPEDLSFPVMPPFGSWVKSVDEESGIKSMLWFIMLPPCRLTLSTEPGLWGCRCKTCESNNPKYLPCSKLSSAPQLWDLSRVRRLHVRALRYTNISHLVHHKFIKLFTFANQKQSFTLVNSDFLRTLLQVNGAPVEALTAAAIREIYQLRKADRNWLVKAGRTLSVLLKDDYDRLRFILSQIHP